MSLVDEILKAENPLTDPNATEDEKNSFSLAMGMFMMHEYTNGKWKEDRKKWDESQTEICKQLLFEGAEIRLMEGCMSGAYLHVPINEKYEVDIELPGEKTLEEVIKREEYTVRIQHLDYEGCENEEEGEIFNSNYVKSFEEAKEIVRLLKEDQFEKAFRVLYNGHERLEDLLLLNRVTYTTHTWHDSNKDFLKVARGEWTWKQFRENRGI